MTSLTENPSTQRPKHSIAEGSDCMVCCEDLTINNYAEYLPYPPEDGMVSEMEWEEAGWLPSPYFSNCIETEFLPNQLDRWIDSLQKATCKAEQRRILTPGPPINSKDVKGMPCPNNGEVYKLWYSKDNVEKVAKLEGSLVGKARLNYWDELKQFACCFEDDINDKDPQTIAEDDNSDEKQKILSHFHQKEIV